MELPETLAEFLSHYPESVLLKWLKTGQKAVVRRKNGPSRRALANRKLKNIDIDKLQKELLSK